MEVDLYNSRNQSYWSDPELGQFGAQAVSTNGYVSSYPPPATFQPLPQPQVVYWTPPKQQPKVVKPAPEIVKPEPVKSYVAYQVFAFIVTVFCNCVFGAVAWVLALIAQTQRTSDPATARTCAWASCGVAVAGIIATGIIIGVTAGVLLSNQCQYYYVKGVCYRYRTPAGNYNGGCDSTLRNCCPSGYTLYIFDGSNGYCYQS